MTLRRARACLLLCSALTLAACVSSGTKVSAEDTKQFKVGVTTEQEIIAKLGTPNKVITNTDGSKVDIYLHVASNIHAASFIPVVGIFAGGTSTNSDSATFTFDPQNVLKSISNSSGQQDVNTGLLNQH